MKRKKTKKLLLSIIFAVLVISGDLLVLIYTSNVENRVLLAAVEPEFNRINIKEIENNYNKYTLKYDLVKDANKYVVNVISEEKEIVNVTSESDFIEFEIPIANLVYGNEYTFNINVYKDDALLLRSDSAVSVKWNQPSFNKDNKTSIGNKTYNIQIDGNLDDNYRLVIKNKKKTLYSKKITNNKFKVPANLYKNKNIDLTFNLYYKDKLISTYNASNSYKKVTTKKVNPIKNVSIKTPSSYLALKDIKDVSVEFTGGENSTSKNIYIYEDSKLIKKDTLVEENYIISSSVFKENRGYIVKVEATDGKFSKEDSIYISTIKDGRSRMVDIAKQQIGNSGSKYWKWWGFNGFVEWCAIFVSWVSNQNGYLDAKILPKKAGCGSFVKWFKNKNQYKVRSSGYVPQPGDIIFFDYNPENAIIDHVGIVEYSDGKYVYTIEGNSGPRPNTKVTRKKYAINNGKIHGYGIPQY